MIPRTTITMWREHHAPWSGDDQVEQDLVISRALIELYSDELISKNLAFRGGTALNKLILPTMSRYSEDIDLVQTLAQPIGPVLDRIKEILTPWLGKATYKQTNRGTTLYFSYKSEPPLEKPMKLKVSLNTRESFSVFGYENRSITIISEWFSGQANIKTFAIDELLGTKLRALYQRKQGRDLFDLWLCCTTLTVDPDKVINCFLEYMKHNGLKVSQAEFENNLQEKLKDPAFRNDIVPLIRPGVNYDVDQAAQLISKEIIAKLPVR
ncbi:MAG: nucleotidyl transferase AbiEii/AbiGii toxin family protein [Candidatus Obscuribacterales bacterium]|nr:nucleotidyl transferase AbiEii/AbiGii toxin family protein [Candidatus Obscuribacterales bacterium]